MTLAILFLFLLTLAEHRASVVQISGLFFGKYVNQMSRTVRLGAAFFALFFLGRYGQGNQQINKQEPEGYHRDPNSQVDAWQFHFSKASQQTTAPPDRSSHRRRTCAS